jgi:ribosome-binding ATPase YchF (GTP1/OBG family)
VPQIVSFESENLPTATSLGGAFLANMQDIDGYFHVLNGFSQDSPTKILPELENITDELILRDLSVVEKRAQAPSL